MYIIAQQQQQKNKTTATADQDNNKNNININNSRGKQVRENSMVNESGLFCEMLIIYVQRQKGKSESIRNVRLELGFHLNQKYSREKNVFSFSVD